MKVLVRVAVRIGIIFLIARGIILILSVISTGLNLIESYASSEIIVWYIGNFIGSLIVIGLLVLAWKKTDWLVNVLAGCDATEELPFQVQSREIYGLALKFLGVWVMVNALPEFIRFLVIYINLFESTSGYDSLLPSDTAPNLIAAGVKIIIGIWLVFGSRSISNFIDNVINIPLNKDVK